MAVFYEEGMEKMSDDFWNDASVPPKAAGKYSVKLADGDEAACFFHPKTGWNTNKPVEKWFDGALPFDESDMAIVAFDADGFTPLSVEELEAMSGDSGLELNGIHSVLNGPESVRDIGVRVNRYFTVNEGATTYSSGKVVAVGVTYAAQHVGGGDMVIHENARLSQPLRPGDEVTIVYRDGDGMVVPGVFQKYEVNIEIPALPRDTVDQVNAMVMQQIADAQVNINNADQVLAAVGSCVEFVTAGARAVEPRVTYIDRLTRETLPEALRFGGGFVDTEREAGVAHRGPGS